MPYISPDGEIYHIPPQHFAKLGHKEVWDVYVLLNAKRVSWKGTEETLVNNHLCMI
jgi:NAD-dependent dihydropyrimidine dehydrogenase PreA subunit